MARTKFFKAFFWLLLLVVVLTAAFAVWFYASLPSNFKNSMSSNLPFPAAFVNGRPIYIKDVLQRAAVGQSDPAAILKQLISERQTAAVAEEFGVSVGSTQLDQQFNALKQQTPDFDSLIARYGLSENDFKTRVLQPELLYNNLEVWFYGQRPLNAAAYALADSIRQQVTATSATSSVFASLAAEYSQDAGSKMTGGDLGFVQTGALRPEFQAMFDSAKPGDVEITAGRDGLYIFQILSKDNNGPNGSPRTEAREIYLSGGNFEDWLNNETKNIKIIKLY